MPDGNIEHSPVSFRINGVLIKPEVTRIGCTKIIARSEDPAIAFKAVVLDFLVKPPKPRHLSFKIDEKAKGNVQISQPVHLAFASLPVHGIEGT